MPSKTPDGQVWLSINEVIAQMGCSRRTVYNWKAKGKLETRLTPGGLLRIAARCLMKPDPQEQMGHVQYEATGRIGPDWSVTPLKVD